MSIIVLNRSNDSLTPDKVIVVYKNESSTYIEWAKVKDFKVQSYMPLNAKILKDIFSFIKIKSKDQYGFRKVIPKNVLFFNNSEHKLELIWYVKGSYTDYFHKKKQDKLFYPNLLFHYKNDNMSIYSFKSDVVNGQTKLFKAPFPNIYDSNKMCFGDMTINDFIKLDLEDTMLNLTDSFYNSKFNQYMSEGRTKCNTDNLFKKILNKKTPFPVKQLVTLDKTINDLI